MKTRILRINPQKPERKKIEEAAGILRKGGLVAFPTETVYGLGANAFDRKAVRKIFSAKGRPGDNPIIAHICSIGQLHVLAEKVPEKALLLAKRFWPGPLTLVLQKKKGVPEEITAGLSSVAVRMPENRIALELIKKAGVPVAAPSANLSGRPSPTKASHVIEDLIEKIDAVIDGGSVSIGIESTVLDMTAGVARILRPGKITQRQIESITGMLDSAKPHPTEKPKSPGMKYRHYSPKARILLVKGYKEIEGIMKRYPGKNIRILRYGSQTEMARRLFDDFRDADRKGYGIIIVREVKDSGLGSAIMDRLRKAAMEKSRGK